MSTVSRSKYHRVAEVFGPTIQGEGRNVGMPCHFVRFGGCDFRCTWCDTPHAVLPELVSKLPKMDEWGIIAALSRLDERAEFSPHWIVLTGGNPALRDLAYLIELLHVRNQKVMLETQGSTYRKWFVDVDDLCFSPKPPSSKMEWNFDLFDRVMHQFLSDAAEKSRQEGGLPFLLPYLKVPVFTLDDLEFAKQVHHRWSDLEMFISIGNDSPTLATVGKPNPEKGFSFADKISTRQQVLEHFEEWTDIILKEQDLAGVRIFPQQHTLIWGNERGR